MKQRRPSLGAEQTDGDGALPEPVFRCRRTWLVAVSLGLLWWLSQHAPLNPAMLVGLDAGSVRVGLGIFSCIAVLWMSEAMPLAATALLVPMLAVLLRVMDVQESLLSFADPLIFLFFGGFALASAMAYQGVDRWLAQALVRLGRGRFLPVACWLFGGTAFISMWMSNTATAAMMMPLGLGILAQGEGTHGARRNASFLLLGLAYSASIGGLGTIIGSPPNGIAAKELGVSFGEWIRFGLPTVAVLLPVMIGLLLWLTKPARETRIPLRDERFQFDGPRKMTLAIFGGAAGCWVFGGWIGPRLGITSSFDTVVALLAFFALLFFRVVRWRDIERGTDWGVLMLFGGGIALSAVLRDSGASLYLARAVTGTVRGLPWIALVGSVVLFVIFLTELSSNTAVAALFVPIFAAVAGEMHLPTAQLVLPLALAASCAFMLPVATPPNAIVYGTGKITQRDMMRAGFVLNAVFALFLTAIAWAFF